MDVPSKPQPRRRSDPAERNQLKVCSPAKQLHGESSHRHAEGMEEGGEAEQNPGLKDTPSALQSVLPGGDCGQDREGELSCHPFGSPGWGGGGRADPPQSAPSEPGSASREELGSACTTASWIFLF